MKKVIMLSAALLLASGPGFAQTAGTYTSQRQCQFHTHGTCVQQGSNWVASPSSGTTAAAPAAGAASATGGHTWAGHTATTPTTPATTPAAEAPATSAAPAAPAAASAAPAAAPAAAQQQQGKSWWPFSKNGAANSGDTNAASDDEKPGTAAAAAAANAPKLSPEQIARGKPFGSEGECKGQTGGNCRSTDCSTHVGGVCEHTKGVVWTYVGGGK